MPIISKIKVLFTWIVGVAMLISVLVNPPLAPFVPEPYDPGSVEVEKMLIADNGASDYVIVRGAACSASEENAALTLQSYLKQISGATLPIVTDAAPVAEKEIIVGKTNREGAAYTVDRAALGDEGLTIRTVGRKLVIAGGEKRGTLYGVYTFLEEVLGCHWYTASLIVVPPSPKLEIPVELNITQKPRLEYRETDWISPRDAVYSVANKLNGNTYRSLSPAQGSTVGYTGGFCHTLTTSILPSSVYFAQHPEYYAWDCIKKQRTPNQLCLTNPDVLALVIQQVRSMLAANPGAQIISLTQHDNQDYCTCDACKAVDEYEGSHSGTMIRFVNAVADAVKDDYPNVAIDTFAYQYTRKAPKHVVPRDNVIVRLCSIECCFAHDLDDPACSDNVNFCADLRAWKEICKRLYVWDYTTNYGNFLGPFPDFGVIQDNIRFFTDNNVVGIYEEGNYMAAQCNAEFAELRAYMLAKLMWNPNLDYDRVMNGFLMAYYGDGWQYVREYIDMTTRNTGTRCRHMHIFDSMTDKGVLDLTPNDIAYCDGLWAKAEELAQTPDHLRRVQMSELSWRYWKGCNKAAEFSRWQLPEQWKGANKRLFRDYGTFGITRFSEGAMLTARPDFCATPDKWRD
ncbi:MAG: hypothetical protein BWY37_01982 [Firmicutes bacterium ADurb.Bin262]|nr:MAG: hypothetical protein BWY37_01982 [Firmicutes bacterium ADurb.Bin262]